MPLILGTNSIKDTGYNVANSLRFNDGSSDSLSRSFGTPSSTTTWTISFWVKKCTNGSALNLSSQGVGTSNEDRIRFDSSDRLEWTIYKSAVKGKLVTNRLFRDNSAWYNIVCVWDTTNGTAGDRMRMYVNGIEETSFSTDTNPNQNETSNFNTSATNYIGSVGSGEFFDGYMTEVVFLDDTAVSNATSFGEFDEDSPTIWKPKDVSGLTFGTNGFYLDFENSGSLGADVSGNSNNFTVNNLTSVDQSIDSCTNNFCTLNPLNFGHGSLSEGNLKWTASAQAGNLAFGTIGIDMDVSNQFYWETKIEGGEIVIGIAPTTLRWNDTGRAGSYGYYSDGNKYSGTSASSYGASFTTNDIIGVLVGNGTLTFYKNGASQGTAFSSLSGTYLPFLAEVGSTNSMNFGSPPYSISSGNTDPEGYGNFEYSTNSGYALNTKNLAEYG